jgi:hypothetical protein
MNPEDKSKIDELKKSLYSRSAPEIKQKRRLKFALPQKSTVATDWEHPQETKEEVELNKEYKDNTMAFTTKLFIGSLIFFICAMALGALLIFRGENIISADNIDITINGPVTIAGGDTLNFDVQIKNNNNVTLEAVDLDIDFPAGTVSAADRTKEYRKYRQTLDNIRPGGRGEQNVSAVLYGEENSKKQIKVNVSYRVKGSNAVFEKTKVYDILISSSPLSITVNSFKEVTSGQEFGVEVTLTSNSSEIMKNLLLRAEFPFGFTLTSTDIKAEGNRGTWKIGDVPPKGKKTIRFKGNLEGQDGERRVFKFTAGTQSAQRPGTIGTEFIASNREVAIKKPFMSTGIMFNDESGEAIGSFNTPVKTTLSWFNNLPTEVTDGEIRVKLSGNAFDRVSVAPGEGYYQSTNNEIVWNKQTTQTLGSIGAGENGNIFFNFTPHNFSTPSRGISNPSVTVEVNVSGKRLSESNVPETVTTSARKTIKISSNLTLGAQLFRKSGAFENTGPIPPRADQQTTYTITWTVDNTVNTVSGAQVRGILPVYVKWLGKVSPSTEDVVYNANGEVVWRIGNVDTFTQYNGRSRKVSFQVAVQPSLSQVGQAPFIMQNMGIQGVDDFTGQTLAGTAEELSTRYSDGFRDGDQIVTP